MILLKKRKKGISLIEMIIVVGVLSIVSLILSRFLVSGFATYRINKEGIDSEEQGARVMRDFESSVRAASSIITADSRELTFYRYYDLTSISPKKIHYFIEGKTFKVGVTEPVGTPPDIVYPTSDEKIDYLIENVTGLAFNFFDDAGSIMTVPPNQTAVRMIELVISVDKDPSTSPPGVTMQTKVNLRNLKKNL